LGALCARLTRAALIGIKETNFAVRYNSTNLKNFISHREHRDHRGETNGYHEIAPHLLGEPANHGKTFSFSVPSVNSVA
jgi:hypothetical protein